MALSEIIKVDFSFKKLEGREETTVDKQWYEEFAGRLLYSHAKDVWVDDIPIPAPSSDTAVVKVYTNLILTRDVTVNYNKSWLCCDAMGDLTTRLKGFIPPRFDQSYTARIFENNGDEIPTAHPSNWVFDYENGILFFENNPANYGIELPIHLKVYRYVGKTLKNLIDSGIGGGDNTKVITDGIAAEDISAYTIVYFRGDGKVRIASKDNEEVIDSIVGITYEDVLTNENVSVILTGRVVNNTWSLEENTSYFLGIDGSFTKTIPTENEILLKIGTASDINTLVFEPKIAIRR